MVDYSMNKGYITLRQAHEKYGVPIDTLRDWIKRDLLVKHQIAPKARVYIDPLEIPAWFRGVK